MGIGRERFWLCSLGCFGRGLAYSHTHLNAVFKVVFRLRPSRSWENKRDEFRVGLFYALLRRVG